MHRLHEVAKFKYGVRFAEMPGERSGNVRSPATWLIEIAITLRDQDMTALVAVGGEY